MDGVLNLMEHGIISHKNRFKGKEVPNTGTVLWLLLSTIYWFCLLQETFLSPQAGSPHSHKMAAASPVIPSKHNSQCPKRGCVSPVNEKCCLPYQ